MCLQLVALAFACVHAHTDMRMCTVRQALRVLVPFVPTICPVVDVEAGYIYMRPPKGLLDEMAFAPPKKRVVIRGLLPLYGESCFWDLSCAAGMDRELGVQLNG